MILHVHIYVVYIDCLSLCPHSCSSCSKVPTVSLCRPHGCGVYWVNIRYSPLNKCVWPYHYVLVRIMKKGNNNSSDVSEEAANTKHIMYNWLRWLSLVQQCVECYRCWCRQKPFFLTLGVIQYSYFWCYRVLCSVTFVVVRWSRLIKKMMHVLTRT